MDQERLEKVEIKMAYLEDMVSQLNDIVIAQEKIIEEQKVQIAVLKRKFEDFVENGGEEIPNRRPPHY